jgi:hypothetical protein
VANDEKVFQGHTRPHPAPRDFAKARDPRVGTLLGPYPALTPEAARNKARELVSGVKIAGRDPVAEKKAARAARRKAGGACGSLLCDSTLFTL